VRVEQCLRTGARIYTRDVYRGGRFVTRHVVVYGPELRRNEPCATA
jgi:hypothetical protein